MILYLDTSALVKLYVREGGTDRVRYALREATVVVCSEIAYVEACVTFAAAEHDGRISAIQHDHILRSLARDLRKEYLSRAMTSSIIARAGEFARSHSLNGYVAIHLATALAVREEARDLVKEQATKNVSTAVSLVTFDKRLARAARREGMPCNLSGNEE